VKIETTAKLILTVPDPKEGEFAGDYVLAAEQYINGIGFTEMLETRTKVGIRIHTSGQVPKVTE